MTEDFESRPNGNVVNGFLAVMLAWVSIPAFGHAIESGALVAQPYIQFVAVAILAVFTWGLFNMITDPLVVNFLRSVEDRVEQWRASG